MSVKNYIFQLYHNLMSCVSYVLLLFCKLLRENCGLNPKSAKAGKKGYQQMWDRAKLPYAQAHLCSRTHSHAKQPALKTCTIGRSCMLECARAHLSNLVPFFRLKF